MERFDNLVLMLNDNYVKYVISRLNRLVMKDLWYKVEFRPTKPLMIELLTLVGIIVIIYKGRIYVENYIGFVVMWKVTDRTDNSRKK